MQFTRTLLCLTTTTLLLAGCSTPPAATDANAAPEPTGWQLSNSTALGLVGGTGFSFLTIWHPFACAQADFRVPGGTLALEATLSNPPMVDQDQPGAGQMGLSVVAPNETYAQDDHLGGPDIRVTLLDPPPGRWTVRVYATPAVVNQHANVTVTLRGDGNMTMPELLFWHEPIPAPWDAVGCPGPR